MPDNFNDEGDGQRRHKYSTADLKPERPWKRWCITCICCLIVVAIMILISIYMQKLFDPDEDEDWNDDSVNGTDDDLVGSAGALSGAAALLPKSMDYVEDVCSEQRIGQDDRTACEEACGPADDCCDPFANGNSTCFEGQTGGCFSYAKCHSLSGASDPAHIELDRICSRAGIENDPTECYNACSGMACCFTPEESCVSENFQACMDYAPCQNLKEDSIDVAPTDLDERCGKQTPSCDRDCREALCCSDPNSACYRDNFIACLSYASCTGNSDTKVLVAPIYSRVPAAPDVLNDVCSIKGFADFGGPEKCLEACANAQCCWDTGAGGCFGDDPLGCLEYERCTLLNEPQYADLTFPPGTAATTAPAPAVTEAPADDTTSTETSAPSGNETNTEG